MDTRSHDRVLQAPASLHAESIEGDVSASRPQSDPGRLGCVTFFGMVRMVNAVLPGMSQRKHGLIVNLGSLAATLPIPFHGYLTASKAAVNAYPDALRLEVRSLGIQVALVEPVTVRTHLGEHWTELKVPRSIQDYAAVEQDVLVKLEHVSGKSTDPQVVAQTILRILQSRAPAPHYLMGKEHWYLLLSRIVPALVVESVLSKRLELAG